MKNYKYKFSHTILFSLLALLSFSFVLTSCDKDDEDNGTKIWTVGPGNVNRGDLLKVSGQKISDISAVILPSLDGSGIEISSSEFLNKTENYFEVKLPNDKNFVSGNVIFKLSNGNTITSKVSIKVGALVLEGFSPATAKAGDEITITGDYLTLVETVTFASNQTVKKDDFVSQSNTEIKVKLPDAAQTGNISISDGNGAAYSDTQINVTLPALAEVAFEAKDYKPGVDKITINGTDMDLVATVKFDGAEVTEFDSQSETAITFIVPAATKEGEVYIIPASEINIKAGDITLVKPIINEIEYTRFDEDNDGKKTYYYYLGDELTITGSNLDLITTLSLGSYTLEKTEYTVASDNNSINLVIPEKATSGIKSSTANSTEVDVDLNIKAIDLNGAYWSYSTDGEAKYVGGGKVVIGNCDNLKYAVSARIGDNSVRDFTVIDNNSFSFVIPEYVKGQQQLFVKATNGEESQVWNIQVEECSYPYLSSIPENATTGENILVEGGNLGSVTSIKFGDKDMPVFSNVDGTSMFIKIPSGSEYVNTDYIVVSDGTNTVKSPNKIQITLSEVVLLEKTQDLGKWDVNWSVFPQNLFKDVKKNNKIRIYVTVNDATADGDYGAGSWQLQFFDGSWGKYTAFDGGNNVHGSAKDVEGGFVEISVNDSFYNSLQNNTDWGGAIIIQGENLTITKITYLP